MDVKICVVLGLVESDLLWTDFVVEKDEKHEKISFLLSENDLNEILNYNCVLTSEQMNQYEIHFLVFLDYVCLLYHLLNQWDDLELNEQEKLFEHTLTIIQVMKRIILNSFLFEKKTIIKIFKYILEM